MCQHHQITHRTLQEYRFAEKKETHFSSDSCMLCQVNKLFPLWLSLQYLMEQHCPMQCRNTQPWVVGLVLSAMHDPLQRYKHNSCAFKTHSNSLFTSTSSRMYWRLIWCPMRGKKETLNIWRKGCLEMQPYYLTEKLPVRFPRVSNSLFLLLLSIDLSSTFGIPKAE